MYFINSCSGEGSRAPARPAAPHPPPSSTALLGNSCRAGTPLSLRARLHHRAWRRHASLRCECLDDAAFVLPGQPAHCDAVLGPLPVHTPPVRVRASRSRHHAAHDDGGRWRRAGRGRGAGRVACAPGAAAAPPSATRCRSSGAGCRGRLAPARTLSIRSSCSALALLLCSPMHRRVTEIKCVHTTADPPPLTTASPARRRWRACSPQPCSAARPSPP